MRFWNVSINSPKGWCNATINDISDKIHYGYTEKSNVKPIGPKFLRITDIQNNYVDWNKVPFCKIKEEEKQKYLLKPYDLVFARTGATVGKSYLIGGNIPESVFASYLIRVILNPHISAKFVYLFFQSSYYWSQISRDKAGIGQPNVNATKLAKLRIPIPPLPEQRRIVAKIEELFTKLDAGVAALKEARKLLKRYRQSVLKAAVEGRLTAQWREQHKHELEPANKLLEQIQAEHKAKLGKKYNEPKPVDTTDLPQLPEGWVWIQLQLISDWANGKGLTRKNMQPGDYLVYGGNGVTGSHYKYLIENDCIVIGRVGANCGNVNIAYNKSWITDNAIYSKWLSKNIEIKFIQLALKNMNLNKIAGGSGQPYVSQRLLNSLYFPLPPIKEQNKIVEEYERLFSIIDETEQVIESELKRAQSLRQSILKRTFGGKLVPQDPNDEPASVLLERIRKQKEAIN